jgi:hypothetical protein
MARTKEKIEDWPEQRAREEIHSFIRFNEKKL